MFLRGMEPETPGRLDQLSIFQSTVSTVHFFFIRNKLNIYPKQKNLTNVYIPLTFPTMDLCSKKLQPE